MHRHVIGSIALSYYPELNVLIREQEDARTIKCEEMLRRWLNYIIPNCVPEIVKDDFGPFVKLMKV